jgi:CO/xanthine dehydrogenase FAD-binding subunit
METPRDLSDALERLAQEPGVWKPFAGGTDLMVLLEAGKLPHRRFLNVSEFSELRGIEIMPEYVTLGALTTYTEIRRSEVLAREFPLLCRAAAETGSVATQNRGTLGGNIANASPAADSPPALLVYDAELELVSVSGARWVAYQGFWTGYKQIGLRADELIRAIRLPRGMRSWSHYYRKVGTRRPSPKFASRRPPAWMRAESRMYVSPSAASRPWFYALSRQKRYCETGS